MLLLHYRYCPYVATAAATAAVAAASSSRKQQQAAATVVVGFCVLKSIPGYNLQESICIALHIYFKVYSGNNEIFKYIIH